MKKIFKIIAAMAFIPFIIYFWPTTLGGDAEFLMVQGNSMLPTILPGSLVVTKTAPSYQIDDIVAYDESKRGFGKKIVVHRIIDETPNGFVIQGDNNPKKDPGLPTADIILGKVVFSTPYVGDVLASLRNPVVLIMTIGVVAVIQYEFKKRAKKKERIRQIRLGITPKTANQLLKTEKPKEKKPDYTLFIAAIGFNVLTFVINLFLISEGKRVLGDMFSGFLYGIFYAEYASIVAFVMYCGIIFGLFYLAKKFEKKQKRKNFRLEKMGRKPKKSYLSSLWGKNSHPMMAVASLGWLMFLIMSIFYLMERGRDFASILT